MDSRLFAMAVGLVSVYALYSIAVSHFNALIAQILRLRSKLLAETLRTKLLDPELTEKLLAHPLVQSQTQNGGTSPTRISPEIFARTLIELIKRSDASGTTWKEIVDEASLPKALRDRLAAVVGKADRPIEEAEQRIASWFDRTMDNLSGRYRRNAQLWSFLLGLLLAAGTNADTIRLAKVLWRDPVQRQAEAALATKLVDQCQRDDAGSIQCPTVPLWSDVPLQWTRDAWAGLGGLALVAVVLWKVIGLMATALAVSLGAPFWFDLLGKVSPQRGS